MIGAAEKAGLIVGFKAAAKAPIISHLQFADDMLIFCGAEEDQVRSIKAMLLCFEAVSGLTINFYKSELIGMRVEERCLQHFAGILGCKTGSFPVSYLGLPLCMGHMNRAIWNLVVERMEKRLSTWAANYLSFGGRITLIRSSLTFQSTINLCSNVQ